MPTLVKETGAGLANANSYADVADGDAYADNSLNAKSWQDAQANDKARALIMATRAVDNLFQWNGSKTTEAQALQWPRAYVEDPDASRQTPGLTFGAFNNYLDEAKVPSLIVQGTCHLAMELLKTDRFEEPSQKGIKSIDIDDALKIEFDGNSEQPAVVTDYVERMLGKYGTSVEGGANVRLERA